MAEVKEKGINNDKHLAKDKVICQIFFLPQAGIETQKAVRVM